MKSQTKYFVLSVVAVVLATVWAFAWFFSGERDTVLRWGYLWGHASVAVAAWSTAFVFGSRDRMRWAWMCLAVVGTMNLVDLVVRPQAVHVSTQTDTASLVMALTLNTLSVVALFLFVRTWAAAGILPPWRHWAALGGLMVGLGAAGVAVWNNTGRALDGDAFARLVVISSLGDIASLTLLGPLLGSAIWMRGGSVMWPYALLTAESVAWLVFDVSTIVDPSWTDVTATLTPIFAWHLVAAAAIAHRWVVREASIALSGSN